MKMKKHILIINNKPDLSSFFRQFARALVASASHFLPVLVAQPERYSRYICFIKQFHC
jgi:hypothetical protein